LVGDAHATCLAATGIFGFDPQRTFGYSSASRF
jgi:hypothetical protein